MEFALIERTKKDHSLARCTFGCLKGHYSINITVGCSFSCVYCYARGYPQTPPKGKVYLFHNLASLVREQLSSRRRKIPITQVVFNTASDCFQPHPAILKVTYEVMAHLLTHGASISFVTKGVIPRHFIELFSKHSEQLAVSVGLVSVFPAYTSIFEPRVPSPQERLDTIRSLVSSGITPTVRMDPLIPFLTDTPGTLEPFFKRLEEAGVKTVSLNYLHLRPAIAKHLQRELPPTLFRIVESFFLTQPWRKVGISTKSKLIPLPVREKGYRRIADVAGTFGIKTLICSCKNPELSFQPCQLFPPPIQKELTPARKQASLF